MTSLRKLYQATSWFVVIVFPLIVVFFIRLYFVNEKIYRDSLLEDHVVEWLTTIWYLLAGLAFFALAVLTRKKEGYLFWFLAALGAFCLFTMLEEISWGKRILGTNPSFFGRQATLHNTFRKMTGLRSVHISLPAMLLYGVILPILALNDGVRSYLERKRIVVPPLPVAFGFFIATALAFFDAPTQLEDEIAEMLYGLAFLFIAIMEAIKLASPDRVPHLEEKVASD